MTLTSKHLTLTPITASQKDEFYQLATKSYGSQFWYDAKTKEARSKKDFFKSWNDDYFNPEKPLAGQCYWIVTRGKRIGQINYNPIDQKNKRTELDIIIGLKKHLSQGYGPEAMNTLARYLFSNFKLNKIWIEARGNNPRAVKAYAKAGFTKEGVLRQHDYFKGKFVDCVRFSFLRKDLTT